jgi:hypothetical protein
MCELKGRMKTPWGWLDIMSLAYKK